MEKNGKHIVVPGELVTEERKKLGSHVYLHQGRIYADSLGIARVDGDMASVVPLEGKYQAMAGDLVVGVLVSEKFDGLDTAKFSLTIASAHRVNRRFHTATTLPTGNPLTVLEDRDPMRFSGRGTKHLAPPFYLG